METFESTRVFCQLDSEGSCEAGLQVHFRESLAAALGSFRHWWNFKDEIFELHLFVSSALGKRKQRKLPYLFD